MNPKPATLLLIGISVVLIFGTLMPGELEATIQRWLGVGNEIQPISHFLLFTMLAALLAWSMPQLPIWAPLAICLLPALGSEWLQHFSPQRHPRFSDIGIDMLGAVTGWLGTRLGKRWQSAGH